MRYTNLDLFASMNNTQSQIEWLADYLLLFWSHQMAVRYTNLDLIILVNNAQSLRV